jgi:hypothetical protein
LVRIILGLRLIAFIGRVATAKPAGTTEATRSICP